MLESGSSDFILPEIKIMVTIWEYLQDQFLKIDLAQQLNIVKKILMQIALVLID